MPGGPDGPEIASERSFFYSEGFVAFFTPIVFGALSTLTAKTLEFYPVLLLTFFGVSFGATLVFGRESSEKALASSFATFLVMVVMLLGFRAESQEVTTVCVLTTVFVALLQWAIAMINNGLPLGKE